MLLGIDHISVQVCLLGYDDVIYVYDDVTYVSLSVHVAGYRPHFCAGVSTCLSVSLSLCM